MYVGIGGCMMGKKAHHMISDYSNPCPPNAAFIMIRNDVAISGYYVVFKIFKFGADILQ